MILVTGGAGFLGSQLSKALLEQGENVRVLDIQPIEDSDLRARVEFVAGDIRDHAVVQRAMEGISVAYHVAAVLPIAKAGPGYYEVNVEGTRAVLEAAQRAGARKVIYVSSSAVYGIPKELPLTETSPFAPLGVYGTSKRKAEMVCEAYREKGLNVSIVRPRTIVGPGRLGIFSILFDWIYDGKNIYTLGDGNNIFQFLDNRDLIAVCLALKDKGDFEDFNIGSEKFGTYRDDINALIAHANTKTRLVYLPASLARAALRLLDRFGLSPLVDWHYETIDKPFYFDITKTKTLLDWSPRYSNQQSLFDAYDWYARNRETRSFGTTHNKSLRQHVLKVIKFFS